jgi:hypothetical protein
VGQTEHIHSIASELDAKQILLWGGAQKIAQSRVAETDRQKQLFMSAKNGLQKVGQAAAYQRIKKRARWGAR